jgi:serine/threonine-protein kinase
MAQLFDPDRGELSGQPLAIADEIQTDTGSWSAAFSVSTTGLLAFHGGASPATRLAWLDRETGERTTIGDEGAVFATPRLSPDVTRLAVTVGNPGDIWVYELDRNVGTRLTRDSAYEWNPIWSPDGKHLAYCANFTSDGLNYIYTIPLDGSSERAVVVNSAELLAAMDWSSKDDFMVYWQGGGFPNGAYWIKKIDSDEEPVLMLEAPFATGSASVSPDGRWIAYSSNESGTDEVYIAEFVPTEPSGPTRGKQRVSTAGGRESLWRQDGKELFYSAPGDTLMAVTISVDADRLSVGATSSVGTVNSTRSGLLGTNYDVTPDGKRFIFPSSRGAVGQPISLVINWPAELGGK